jgi:hypothetical protein
MPSGVATRVASVNGADSEALRTVIPAGDSALIIGISAATDGVPDAVAIQDADGNAIAVIAVAADDTDDITVPFIVDNGLKIESSLSTPDTKSVDFDDTEWLETVDTTIGIADAWTIAVWWKPVSLVSEAVFTIRRLVFGNDDIMLEQNADSGSRWGIRIDDDNTAEFKQYKSASTFTTGIWYHVGITWDGVGDILKIFVDGVDDTGVKTVDQTVQQTNSSRILKMGHNVAGSSSNGKGRMYSAAVWDSTLSAAEMLSIYNEGSGDLADLSVDFDNYASAADLVHWYRLGLAPDPNIGKDYGLSPLDASSGGSSPIDDSDVVVDAPSGSGGSPSGSGTNTTVFYRPAV